LRYCRENQINVFELTQLGERNKTRFVFWWHCY
jgi:hypothetical protein